jgi:uncharacterized BrkB/YihY/UPF0761 family membrane protein
VIKKYSDDNAGNLAVQLTFAMFVTIFPLMLLLLTILESCWRETPQQLHGLSGLSSVSSRSSGSSWLTTSTDSGAPPCWDW